MRARVWLGAGLLSVGGLFAGIACGANDAEAPRTQHSPAERSCKSFDELMPNFVAAINTGQTEGLAQVFRDSLLVSPRPGVPPPANDVLRAIFGILAGYASQPPEAGAPPGELCSQTPPPPDQAQPMCELRRALDLLVHQQAGIDTLRLLDPLVSGAMDYLTGKEPSSAVPHYEVSGVISAMCRQSYVCQMSDTLDLLTAFIDFSQTPEGKKATQDIVALVNNPALAPYLSDDAQTYGGENGVVALANALITTIEGMTDPSALDALPIDQLPADLQPDFKAAIADMKLMLDPARQPNLLAPMKKALHCVSVEDPNSELVRMGFRLGLEDKLPAFGLHNLINLLQTLLNNDPRGTLPHLAKTLLGSLRQDDQAMASMGKVCETLFSNDVPAGETQSNAQKALPVVDDLFSQGVVEEGVCAADTLLYGCAGGTQPACEAAPSSSSP